MKIVKSQGIKLWTLIALIYVVTILFGYLFKFYQLYQINNVQDALELAKTLPQSKLYVFKVLSEMANGGYSIRNILYAILISFSPLNLLYIIYSGSLVIGGIDDERFRRESLKLGGLSLTFLGYILIAGGFLVWLLQATSGLDIVNGLKSMALFSLIFIGIMLVITTCVLVGQVSQIISKPKNVV